MAHEEISHEEIGPPEVVESAEKIIDAPDEEALKLESDLLEQTDNAPQPGDPDQPTQWSDPDDGNR